MVLINESGPDTLGLGDPGPDFHLPATDGRTRSLAEFTDCTAVVLAFTCNHCPYARAYDERFADLVATYSPRGVGFAAISANDAENYPADSFEKMQERTIAEHLAYPFLYDETQETAKAYGAVCTPHFFVLGPDRSLVYEGRLDDNYKAPDQVKHRDLQQALEAVLAGAPVPNPQTNPMGCSIKWKG